MTERKRVLLEELDRETCIVKNAIMFMKQLAVMQIDDVSASDDEKNLVGDAIVEELSSVEDSLREIFFRVYDEDFSEDDVAAYVEIAKMSAFKRFTTFSTILVVRIKPDIDRIIGGAIDRAFARTKNRLRK